MQGSIPEEAVTTVLKGRLEMTGVSNAAIVVIGAVPTSGGSGREAFTASRMSRVVATNMLSGLGRRQLCM